MKRLGHRRCWPRRPQSQRPMRSRGVVVRGVPGKHLTEVSLTEDQHPVALQDPPDRRGTDAVAENPRWGYTPQFYDTRIGPERKKRNHVRQLEALGYKVTLEPAAWTRLTRPRLRTPTPLSRQSGSPVPD
jgi:hypothetical protein